MYHLNSIFLANNYFHLLCSIILLDPLSNKKKNKNKNMVVFGLITAVTV